MIDFHGTLLEHTDRIAALEAECDGCRTNVLAGIRAAVEQLDTKMGEEPDPDSGIDGSGLLRKIAVMTDRMEPIVQERAARAQRSVKLSDRLKTAAAIGGVIVALFGVALNFSRTHTTDAQAAATPTHAIVDASDSR